MTEENRAAETKPAEEPSPRKGQAQTLRERNPEAWRKQKLIRLDRRRRRRDYLKSRGHRPNRRMTKDKKTGASLKEI